MSSSVKLGISVKTETDIHLGVRCDLVTVAGHWLRDHGAETKNNFHSAKLSLK